jgi:transposase
MENIISETIGCDLGDKTSEICLLNPAGKVTLRTSVRTTQKAMALFFSRTPAHVVIEVGSHSRWVSALLTELGHQVTVANPRRVKLISASDNKTDRHDAELLARLGRADRELLAPVQHRTLQAQADLAVPKARDVLVATRTKLINHVRGTIKSFGLRVPKCSPESFARQAREMTPTELMAALEPIYQVLDGVGEQIKEQDKMIERVAKRYADTAVLSQINGVGLLTALVFLLTLEDKTRFSSSRMVGAYLGLRPRKSKSGDDDPQLRITKSGDPFLRRLLVQAANYTLGPFGKESSIRSWGLDLAKRGGKNAKKRAKVAVARKLAVLMHRLWVTGEVYEPVGYGKRSSEPAAA